MFYEISQNNSGGHFDVNDKLYHRLIIEADSAEKAAEKAEELGCYWDGCHNNMDCHCCGDRWYKPDEPIDMERLLVDGYAVSSYYDMEDYEKKYGGFEHLEPPKLRKLKYGKCIEGVVKINSVEDYAQIIATAYGWTFPDVRIFYKNGMVRDVYGVGIEPPKKKRR